jgi:hypothetical protein
MIVQCNINSQNNAPNIDYKIEIQKINQCAFVKLKPLFLFSNRPYNITNALLHIQMFIFQSF